MPTINANGITLCYEDHGDPSAPPILLVMGLGAQLTVWPDEFIDALVADGFRVIRFDNRDVGLSTKFDAAGIPNIRWTMLRSVLGLSVRTPYTLTDMARDAVGLMDALGIDRAHVVGASMGGMIAQLMAANHAARVLSLTSVMSSTGNRRLPRASKEAMAALTRRPQTDDVELRIAATMNAARVIGSPGYPPDPARLEARVRRDQARMYYPQGFARQVAAIIADGDRRERLARVRAPTLVIHGDGDPLVRPAAGRDTAANIAGAELMIVPGMGHDLPLALIPTIAGAITAHARAAAG